MPSHSYRDAITSFYLENLPEELGRVLTPQTVLPMPPAALPSFAARLSIPGAERTQASNVAMAEYCGQLDTVMRTMPDGCFVRLGSRSPKDVRDLPHKVHTGGDALCLLCESERIREDVHWCVLHEYTPAVIIRPWMPLAKWQEFRCIVRDGRLEGISQYYTINWPEFKELPPIARTICPQMTSFMRQNVLAHAIHKNFVCDLLYTQDGITVIDYNPLTTKTGLCFFDKALPQPAAPEFRFVYNGDVVMLPLL